MRIALLVVLLLLGTSSLSYAWDRQGAVDSASTLNWFSSYDSARAVAKQCNRNVLLVIESHLSANSTLMEDRVLSDRTVRQQLASFVLVKLFQDGDAAQHGVLNFEREKFGEESVPFFAIVDPQEETISTRAGSVTRKDFLQFLQDGSIGISK